MSTVLFTQSSEQNGQVVSGEVSVAFGNNINFQNQENILSCNNAESQGYFSFFLFFKINDI
jgi:hypothetical protein